MQIGSIPFGSGGRVYAGTLCNQEITKRDGFAKAKCSVHLKNWMHSGTSSFGSDPMLSCAHVMRLSLRRPKAPCWRGMFNVDTRKPKLRPGATKAW